MENKICNICHIIQPFSNFYKRTKSKDGHSCTCKKCDKKRLVNYNTNNSDERKAYKKQWLKNNSVSVNKASKKYNDKNKNTIKIKRKLYRKNNLDKIKKVRNEKHKLKYKTDQLYRLKFNIRALIRKSFTDNKFKKSSKTEQMLGCSFEEFKQHIEAKFESWMNWDNYGLYNCELGYGWDIDHIEPLANAKTEEDVIKLNHHSNLQPLCSHTNRNIKKDNYTP